MLSQKTRTSLVHVIGILVAVGFILARRAFDLGPITSLTVLALLAALSTWLLAQLRPRGESLPFEVLCEAVKILTSSSASLGAAGGAVVGCR